MKISKDLAAKIAPRLIHGSSWDQCRDKVDYATGGELDAFQLDMLTDWAITARKKVEPEFSVQP